MAEEERDTSLENLFRKKLEGSEIEPGGNLTRRFMSRLERREFFRFNPFRFNLYYLTAAAAALLAAGILIFSHTDKGREMPVIGNPVPQAEMRVRAADPPAVVAGITSVKSFDSDIYTRASASSEESCSGSGIPSPKRNSSIIISPHQRGVSLKVSGEAGNLDMAFIGPEKNTLSPALTHAKGETSVAPASEGVWNETWAAIEIPETDITTDNGMYLLLPNAFVPSTGGPTGGYYSQRTDEANQVFHAVSSGVSSYYLKIYSKLGLMVFESDDLSMGWDGYYKGQMCSPGVYIWRAGGTWQNGQTIVMSGDVTLLKY